MERWRRKSQSTSEKIPGQTLSRPPNRLVVTWWQMIVVWERSKSKPEETSCDLFIMVVELSGVQFGLELDAWFQSRTGAQRKFDLKSQIWFRTKIARHEVQLPPYYIHFEIVQIQDLVSSNILLMQYWAGLKWNSCPIFFFLGGGGVRVKK